MPARESARRRLGLRVACHRFCPPDVRPDHRSAPFISRARKRRLRSAPPPQPVGIQTDLEHADHAAIRRGQQVRIGRGAVAGQQPASVGTRAQPRGPSGGSSREPTATEVTRRSSRLRALSRAEAFRGGARGSSRPAAPADRGSPARTPCFTASRFNDTRRICRSVPAHSVAPVGSVSSQRDQPDVDGDATLNLPPFAGSDRVLAAALEAVLKDVKK